MSKTNTTVHLSDLPRFSPWPAKLLGMDPCPVRKKTPVRVTREFEQDKWGPLLRKVRTVKGPMSVATADQMFFTGVPAPVLGVLKGKFLTWPMPQYHGAYLDIVAKTLKTFLPASSLVELGCGYGSLILNLALKKDFARLPLWAAEYVKSGVALTKEIAQKQGTPIQTGLCDFRSATITDLRIPPGAVIFTSYAVMYVPQLKAQFVRAIAKFKPKAVVHFESCYEHARPGDLFGLMKKRYIEVNDYNTNLVSLLHHEQKFKRIKILLEETDVIGGNAFLPASVMAWKPI